MTPHKRAGETSWLSSVTSDTDTDTYTKDTVLSTLVLCGIHAREGGCHATEKLEGRRTRCILSDKEMYSKQDKITRWNQDSGLCTFPLQDLAQSLLEARTEEDAHQSFSKFDLNLAAATARPYFCTAAAAWKEGVIVPYWDLPLIELGGF